MPAFEGVKNNVFLLSFITILAFTLAFIVFMPLLCCIEVKAANTKPYDDEGKYWIMLGFLGYVLVQAYRVLLIPVSSVFARSKILSWSVTGVLRCDLKYCFLPLLSGLLIVFAVYTYILYSYTELFIDYYAAVVLASTAAVIGLGVYVSILGVPKTITRSWRKALILGLAVSVPASILAIILSLFLTAIGDIAIYRCSAEACGITPVNPNTHLIENRCSVGVFGLSINILWYLLYVLLLNEIAGSPKG